MKNCSIITFRLLYFCIEEGFLKLGTNDLPDIRHLQTQSTDHHWRLSAEHPKEKYVYRKHNSSTIVITSSS